MSVQPRCLLLNFGTVKTFSNSRKTKVRKNSLPVPLLFVENDSSEQNYLVCFGPKEHKFQLFFFDCFFRSIFIYGSLLTKMIVLLLLLQRDIFRPYTKT